jgi:hypothetical protein
VRLDGDLLPFSPCSPTHVSDRCMLANACPRKTAELTVSSKQTRSSFSRFIPADPSEYASPGSGLRRATWHYSVLRAACRRRSSPRSLHCFSPLAVLMALLSSPLSSSALCCLLRFSRAARRRCRRLVSRFVTLPVAGRTV